MRNKSEPPIAIMACAAPVFLPCKALASARLCRSDYAGPGLFAGLYVLEVPVCVHFQFPYGRFVAYQYAVRVYL